MNQLLIAVVIRSVQQPGTMERSIYRVPPESRLVDIVETAKNRCEIPGDLTCVRLETLGDLSGLSDSCSSPYPLLFDPVDTTDNALSGSDGVFVLREGGEAVYQVCFGGRICSPTWTEQGPALAYYAGLTLGSRKPEYA